MNTTIVVSAAAAAAAVLLVCAAGCIYFIVYSVMTASYRFTYRQH